MLSGFTPPYTPSCRSSLVPAPPWHYAGQVMSLAFQIDREAGQSLLPDRFGAATGSAACHFCEWQSTTDGSELLDPIYAQYKEFFVLLEADRGGTRAFYCPFIYVDQDMPMVRGWLQGLPKKFGSVWMTRSYDLDHPAAAPLCERYALWREPIREGSPLGRSDDQTQWRGRRAHRLPCYADLRTCGITDTDRQAKRRRKKTCSHGCRADD